MCTPSISPALPYAVTAPAALAGHHHAASAPVGLRETPRRQAGINPTDGGFNTLGDNGVIREGRM
jgi:hypothetical protein